MVIEGEEVIEDKKQKKIDNINKFFFYNFLMLNIVDKDYFKYRTIQREKLVDIFDYLVVVNQQNKLEKAKNSVL